MSSRTPGWIPLVWLISTLKRMADQYIYLPLSEWQINTFIYPWYNNRDRIGWPRTNALYLYSGGALFESRPGHRLSHRGSSWFSSVPPHKSPGQYKCATIASFQILSNPWFIYHPTIKRYIISGQRRAGWCKLLLTLASTVILGSESRGTHDHILRSHDSGCRATHSLDSESAVKSPPPKQEVTGC
jgi:hypothetical protein